MGDAIAAKGGGPWLEQTSAVANETTLEAVQAALRFSVTIVAVFESVLDLTIAANAKLRTRFGATIAMGILGRHAIEHRVAIITGRRRLDAVAAMRAVSTAIR